MRLEAGVHLGPYEVLSPLGKGGMGEVYKARDTRLQRAVAVKVLPSHLSSSAEAKERLEREAKAISQLAHPHVCALFDIGHDAGVDYLVMELLEGVSLAARLESGPLPMDQVLELGTQMADALHAAHRRGIVHRDLKPANVMLTDAGVKILDFGLARPGGDALPTPGASEEHTLSSPLTAHGAVVGTLPYMSPEQVEGRPVDARTDVFALGAVLFEMTTGRRAFAGTSPAALVSAILSAEPPSLSSAGRTSPAGLDRLIRTCLARDPDRRWQSARDVGLQLEAMAEGSSPAPGHPERRRRLVPWLLAALTAAVAVVAALSFRGSPAPPRRAFRFTIPMPQGNASPDTFAAITAALSPDGSRLAFVARPRRGRRRLWVRSLDALEPRSLDGTEGASSAFWSPDGRSIAFFADGKLKRLDFPDAAVVPLCDVARVNGLSGTWGRNGQILYAPIEGEAIYRVSTSGGPPTVEVAAEPSPASPRLNWPIFLPDGRRFLYVARLPDRGGELMLAEPGRPPRRVLRVFSNVAYVEPGYLVFVRDGTLLAQRFDPDSGRVAGEPFSIATPVSYELTRACAQFTASLDGTIAYQSGVSTNNLVWIDRTGREVGRVVGPSSLARVRLSFDGTRALFDRVQERSGTYDLWMLDLGRGTETRLTSGEGSEFAGCWLPDGKTVVFAAPRGGPPHLYRLDVATGDETELLPPGLLQFPEDASADGRVLIFSQRGDRGDMDAWTLPLVEGGQPSRLLSSPATEGDVRLSRDGRSISFLSDESGRAEVYVSPFPSAVVRSRVSSGGAQMARWNPNGREIVFLSADRRLVSVPVQTAPTLELGEPTTLFALPHDIEWGDFEIAPDGKRFLVTVPEALAGEQPYTVIVNWPAQIGLSE
jgi:Tol biopolymer transport system component